MIKLKNILLEDSNSNLPMRELANNFLKFSGNTLIFFDAEALGVNAEENNTQLLQLGILVVDGSTMKTIKSLNLKISENDYSRRFAAKDLPVKLAAFVRKRESERVPEQNLDLSNYFKSLPAKNVNEKQALDIFENIIEKYKNPILISHNIMHDFNFIYIRGRKSGIIIEKVPMMDIKKFAEKYFIPAISTLNNSGLIQRLKKFKLVRTKDIDKKSNKKLAKSPEIELEKYTDPSTDEKYLKIYYGNPSHGFGDIPPEIIKKLQNWTEALKDTKTLIDIFSRIIDFLKDHPDLEANAEQYHDIKKVKRIAKKKISKDKNQ